MAHLGHAARRRWGGCAAGSIALLERTRLLVVAFLIHAPQGLGFVGLEAFEPLVLGLGEQLIDPPLPLRPELLTLFCSRFDDRRQELRVVVLPYLVHAVPVRVVRAHHAGAVARAAAF